jgi:hypothetical protein
MANPVVTAIAHETVVKAATNVLSCDIIILEASKKYFQTYRITGAAAPSAPTNKSNPRVPSTSEWVPMVDLVNNFRPSQASDLYIFCTSENDGLAGQVRVDA